jgi:hypothetical protein
VALVLTLLVLHIALSLRPALGTISSDFANYYVPARLVREGVALDRLYERNFLQNEIRRAGIERLGFFAPNPPPNALLLLPFAGLAPSAAKTAWTVTLGLALAGSFLLLRAALPGASAWLLALGFLLQSASLSNALRFGPPYPLLLLALCASLVALLRGRPLSAGLLLAPVIALKLYGLPFVLALIVSRRWRALIGFCLGLGLIGSASVGLLGRAVHDAYLRESLPASLAGETLDPYATSWQSVASVAHRLFQRESELNPTPASDRPGLARALARGGSILLVALGVLACRSGADPRRLRREWAALALAGLAASPLTGTYHLVLLALPVAVLAAEAEGSAVRQACLLGALAFVASLVPLLFGRFAVGWANLAACPRLWALLVLLGYALRGLLTPGRVLLALAVGVSAGATALNAPREESWQRIEAARGYVQAEPICCGGRLAWVTAQGERLVIRDAEGRTFAGAGDVFSPSCEGQELRFQSSSAPGSADDPAGAAEQDRSHDGRLTVLAERAAGALVEHEGAGGAPRVLARGPLRRPRLSPDGRWVAFQAWQAASRSWDVLALERESGRVVVVASGPSNEVEPAWSPHGDRVVFASDRRRGLGFTALFTAPFRP